MKNIKEKLCSPVVWTAVIAQIAGIMAYFNWDVEEPFKMVAIACVEILTLFGILNNPNNREGF